MATIVDPRSIGMTINTVPGSGVSTMPMNNPGYQGVQYRQYVTLPANVSSGVSVVPMNHPDANYGTELGGYNYNDPNDTGGGKLTVVGPDSNGQYYYANGTVNNNKDEGQLTGTLPPNAPGLAYAGSLPGDYVADVPDYMSALSAATQLAKRPGVLAPITDDGEVMARAPAAKKKTSVFQDILAGIPYLQNQIGQAAKGYGLLMGHHSTADEIAAKYVAMTAAQRANQNPTALMALSRGSGTYSNPGGLLMPTLAINGNIRNTYGDTSGTPGQFLGDSNNHGSPMSPFH